ncbi:MAG: thiamine-phosphate kinase [Planctomycetota bacterium]|nr:thiamine-phosphate kinase [Planctomycetota bacterium]
MGKSEDGFIAWLASRYPPADAASVRGIGDDMAVLAFDSEALAASDMLMDGVHFDATTHAPEQIGRKALAVNLSDCAAMAVRPKSVLVSLALPSDWTMDQAKGLILGMEPLSEKYGCRIVGGDTNSWSRGLVVSVTVLAEPWPDRPPVRRGGVRTGDVICVTGRLGGSLLGRHLDFEPRVGEARILSEALGDHLHAIIDISDGLSIDSHRMARASNRGIEFHERALQAVISSAAETAAIDGRSAMDHALNDGEDFELLFAADSIGGGGAAGAMGERTAIGSDSAPFGITPVEFTVIGVAIDDPGVWIRNPDGQREPLEPAGWQHFTE